MTNLHPTIAAALAPFTPAPVSRPPDALSFNDDDVYLVNTVTRQCLRRVGVRADNINQLALMTGMQAKHFCRSE